MSNVTNESMYEQLKAIRVEQTRSADFMMTMMNEIKPMKSHVAGLVQSDLNRDPTISELALRVERIEKRLELVDE